MNWTSIYLKTENLNVFILGTGEVATRRANKFLDHGATVKLVGNELDEKIRLKGAILETTDQIDDLVDWADLVVIASGDLNLSNHVAEIAGKKLVNRADFPEKGNVIVPNSFYVGDVEISIFTGGKSPLISKQLRKRIQSIITEKDIRKIELQDYARSLLKEKVANQKERKKCLYEIFEDETIETYIDEDKMVEAKNYIEEVFF